MFQDNGIYNPGDIVLKTPNFLLAQSTDLKCQYSASSIIRTVSCLTGIQLSSSGSECLWGNNEEFNSIFLKFC